MGLGKHVLEGCPACCSDDRKCPKSCFVTFRLRPSTAQRWHRYYDLRVCSMPPACDAACFQIISSDLVYLIIDTYDDAFPFFVSSIAVFLHHFLYLL